MIQISLFKVGLVAMLLLTLASLVLNIVAIATTVWAEPSDMGLWYPCTLNGQYRDRCFKINPPALIATGTALNCLAFVLIVVSQLAIFLAKFRDSFALYFVIGSELASILSLIFNTIGWYFVFFSTYQDIPIGQNNVVLSQQTMVGLRLGWSFWLMTPSFFLSAFAAMVGAAILGCTCVTNKFERERRLHEKQNRMVDISGRPGQYATSSGNYGYYADNTDPQVLRL